MPSGISIHAPTRGATIFPALEIFRCTFQSTLPRGERQEYDPDEVMEMFISIHAPTRGATLMPCAPPKRLIFQSTLPRGERRSLTANKEMYLEFQSTLPRGERPLKHKKSSLFYYFNPRSHEGSDSNNTLTSFCVKPISIHAPTRGATSWGLMYGFSIKHFNPRSHEGSDSFAVIKMTFLARFQSTLPRGERQLLRWHQ